MTAQYDLMKKDGNRYAEKLKGSGIHLIQREFAGTDHGFIHNGPKENSFEALYLMSNALKNAFNERF